LPQSYSARHSDNQDSCPGCREKSAEIERLRNEVASAQSHRETGIRRMAASPMIWAALGICGVGLLFAILAIAHHG
jgi:hypothetical protein